jgi:putative tryptophan/tyrosine transport system substrate-binding protein
MRRRELIMVLAGSALAAPLAAFAQSSSKFYRLGLLVNGAAEGEKSPLRLALARGLAHTDFIEGKNLRFEIRGAEGRYDRFPQLVADLAANKVDVIVTRGYPATLAAKQSTTLPLVCYDAGDPIGTGLVDSLARPGGTLTGISDVSAEMTPKRLELLKLFAPDLRRVAILWDADNLGMTLRYRSAEAGARALGIEVQPLGVREPDDYGQAFERMSRNMPDAILMVTDYLTVLNRKPVFEFAAANKVPAIFESSALVRDGGLMSYGPDADGVLDRVAVLASRILKGASPAELPFEQPTKFDLAVNLKTAKALGRTVPQLLLAQADEVIE